MKTVYYYLDESGDLVDIKGGGTKTFSIGCVLVNNPEKVESDLSALKKRINDSVYFRDRHGKRDCFHACDDHLDIYKDYVELLNRLDFRAYVSVLNKKSDFFEKIIKEKTKEEIISLMSYKILYDRLLKRRESFNVLIFERSKNKSNSERAEKEGVINSVNANLKKKCCIVNDLMFEVRMEDKNNIVLSIIDYVLHIWKVPQIFDTFSMCSYNKNI